MHLKVVMKVMIDCAAVPHHYNTSITLYSNNFASFKALKK